MVNWFVCLCSKDNWEKVKESSVWATNRQFKEISQIKANDIILFYITYPVKGISGIGKVVSDISSTKTEAWKDFTYRFKFYLLKELKKDKIIPLQKIKENAGIEFNRGMSVKSLNIGQTLYFKKTLNMN